MQGNVAKNDGGGIWAQAGSTITDEGSRAGGSATVKDNTARKFGGGIFIIEE